MHPIERLRWIAWADGESSSTLAIESAWTLADLAQTEPHALVTACRRLIDSHVTAAALWWVAANVLVDPEPETAARALVDQLCSDPTAALAGAELATRYPGASILVVPGGFEVMGEVCAHAPEAAVRVVGHHPRLRADVRSIGGEIAEVSGYEIEELDAAVAGAAALVVEAVAVSGLGVLVAAAARPCVEAATAASLPCWVVAPVGRELHPQLARALEARSDAAVLAISWGEVTGVFGPAGSTTPAGFLTAASCPAAPELLVRSS